MDDLVPAEDLNYLLLDRETRNTHGMRKWQKSRFFHDIAAIFPFQLFSQPWKRHYQLPSDSVLSNLNEFLNQAWFLRNCTFQETVLSCDAVILCGSVALRWNMFVGGSNNLHESIGFRISPVPYGKKRICYERQNRFKSHQKIDNKLTSTFDALSQVLHLWIQLDRTTLGIDGHRILDIPSSFYRYQRPYIDICDLFLPN
jgi:hypothetical protein